MVKTLYIPGIRTLQGIIMNKIEYNLCVADAHVHVPLIDFENRQLLSKFASNTEANEEYPEVCEALKLLLTSSIRAEGYIKTQDSVLKRYRARFHEWFHTLKSL